MDQSELEKYDDELHTLQYRIEQSIRFFFQNQRALLLENIRSANDLRTSMENTVISGTGNSGNSWQIYLVEEPVGFNWFNYLYIVFLIWLIILIFHVIRICNEQGRAISRNSRYIRYEPFRIGISVNFQPLNNGNDENTHDQSNGNASEEEINGQDNENQPINVLPLALNNSNRDEIDGRGNENQPINALLLPPDNEEDANSHGNENQNQEILLYCSLPNSDMEEENNDNEEENNGQGNENAPINVLLSTDNIDNKEENNDESNKNSPVNVLLLPDNNEIKEENNGVGNENAPTNVLLSTDNNDNEEENNDQGNKNDNDNKKVTNGQNNGRSELQEQFNSTRSEITEVMEKLERYIMLNRYDNDNVLPLAPNNSNHVEIDGRGNKNQPINVLLLPPNKKETDIATGEYSATDETTKNDIAEKSNQLFSGSKTNYSPKSQKVTQVECPDQRKDAANQTEDEIKSKTIEKNLLSGLTGHQKETISSSCGEATTTKKPSEYKSDKNNEVEIVVKKVQKPDICKQYAPLPSDSKINNSPELENVTAIRISDDNTNAVVKADNENKEAIETDSGNGLIKEDQEKSESSCSVVANNEEVKNLKENITEADATKKPSENKNDDSNPKDSDVTVESSTLPTEIKTSNLPKSRIFLATIITDCAVDKVIISENKERKVSVETDSKVNLPCNVEKLKDTNIIEVSTKFSSDSETSDLPKSQNTVANKIPDHRVNEVIKTEHKENTDSVERDSNDGSRTSDQKKSQDLSSAVTSNKDAKINMETTVTEKLSENKNDDIKEAESSLEKEKEVDKIQESETVSSENKTSPSPKSQNVTVTETPNINTDDVVKTKDEEKKESVKKDSMDGVVNENQEKSEGFSSGAIKNEDLKNSIEKNMEESSTEKSKLEKDKEAGDMDESQTLLSEKSPNVTISKASDDHIDEVVKTTDEEKENPIAKDGLENKVQEESKDFSSVLAKNKDEKLDDTKLEDNKEAEVTHSEKESDTGNIEKPEIIPSENKTGNSPKLQNVTVTEISDSHKNEVVKTQDEEKKNPPEITIKTNATEKLSETKIAGNIENKDDLEKGTEIGNIEESTTPTLAEQTSNSPKSQSVAVTTDSHTDKAIKTEDKEKKDSMDKDLEDGLVIEDQEKSTSCATEKPGGDNNDDSKKDEKPSENKTSSSPETQNVSVTENLDQQKDELVKIVDVLINEDLDVKDSSENNMEEVSENKIDEVNENQSDVEKATKADVIEELSILPSESKIDNSSESQNIIAVETPVQHTDEVITTEDDDTNESIEKDSKNSLMKEDKEKTESTFLGAVDNNTEASETEKLSENKNDDNVENKDGVQHVTDADVIEESKPSETSIDHQEEKIVKSENVKEELEEVTRKTETNAAEDEGNKKMQSEDFKEDLSNKDKISAENETGDLGPESEIINMNKHVIPLTELCENKIADISNSQSEIDIKCSNFEDNEVVITQNKEKKIEISSDVVEASSEAIEAETNPAINVLNENEIKDEKSEEQTSEAAGGIENIGNPEDTFDVADKNASCSDSDTEDQGSGSTPNNSGSGNDQLLGGQRRNQKKKRGRKSKHNRY